MKLPAFMTVSTGPARHTSRGLELPVSVQINRRSLSWLRFVYVNARSAYPSAPRWRLLLAAVRTIP